MIPNRPTELPTLYQQFIHKSRYARWLPEEGRRETWAETVERYVDFMVKYLHEQRGFTMSTEQIEEVYDAILNLEVMPSMRAMMTSGPALERDNIAGFNCAYLPFDHIRAFDETLYILMCGTGVGFSAERQHINKLPEIPALHDFTEGPTIVVEDSKMGWAQAIQDTVKNLYLGRLPQIDVSQVRPAGARLKTFGGRASGPEPLVKLFKFIVNTMTNAAGRKLTSIEVHDIACVIGESVVVGGVRRSALISLSNLSDQRMRDAKSGNWYDHTPHRRLANNSTAYDERPEVGQWMREWSSIYESKSGERGIFNRQAAIKQCKRFGRQTSLNGLLIDFGVNPCGEIILRPNQFCNLTEIIARESDTVEDLFRKARIATFLGTYQSCLTDYRYLRDIWTENSREERLLGVSITGIMDCELLNEGVLNRKQRGELLSDLRDHTVDVNKGWAEVFGINASAAITCVKPSGTVSQLVDASSGIHSRHSENYIRRARNDGKDPITDFMTQAGVPVEQDKFSPSDVVFSFPIKAPAGSVTRNERTALQELETWLDFKKFWCHHNPSVTINVRDHEWPAVGSWVWEQFDEIGGISFLPHDDHVYEQAPYEDASEHVVDAMEAAMPKEVDWSLHRETEDNTVGSQEMACSGGSCEIL